MDAFGSNPQKHNNFYFAKKCYFQKISSHSGNFGDIKFPLHDILQGRVWEPSKKSFFLKIVLWDRVRDISFYLPTNITMTSGSNFPLVNILTCKGLMKYTPHMFRAELFQVLGSFMDT